MSQIETPRADRAGPRASRIRSEDAEQLARGGRVRKWDREPLPRDWRFYVGNLGKTLIAVGLLMFGFVGYQLYGTAIETAAAQSDLVDQFEQQLALVDAPQTREVDAAGDASETVVVPGEDEPAPPTPEMDASETVVVPGEDEPAPPIPEMDASASPGAVPVAAQSIPIGLENGDALAKMEIPRIGLDAIVVAGVETGDLKRGPGHFPDTPLPGQLGNAAIAGHRTTYGQPFRNVDLLQVGDEIRMTTLSGVFVYKVTGQAIVEPSEYQVVATTNPAVANLTLTSCHPVFTARQRIVIFSELDRTESAPVGDPVINYGRSDAVEATTEIPGDVDLPADDDTVNVDGESSGSPADEVSVTADEPGSDVVSEGIADAFSEGWFSDPGANPQVGIWGLVVGSIALAAYAISRRFRRDLIGLAVGLIPFTLALYFFFQNVNRLLPPNL